MARSLFTDRPGFRQHILTDRSDPDKFTVHTQEDVEGILKHCKDVRDNRRQGFAETMRPIAEIPMGVYQQALEQKDQPNGISVEQYCRNWASRPENAPFRLSHGSF